MADILPQLEENLKQFVGQRDATKALITTMQEDLTRMFNNAPKRPRATMTDIDKTLADLEQKRTRASLTLTEEKALLKQINAAEREKRALMDRIAHDKKIDSRKAQVQELRNALKSIQEKVNEIEKSITKAKLAAKLNCNVDELQRTEMDCPADKISKVIGRKGAQIKKIEEAAGVSLDVDTKANKIVINGSPAAFAAAEDAINQIIQTNEEEMEISPALNLYLTTASTKAMDVLREKHPNMYFDVSRNSNKFTMRGMPEELAQLKQSLDDFGVIEKKKELTAAEAVLVIGKKGATIEKITSEHKAAIEVSKKSDEVSEATVAGPEAEVAATLQEIESLIDANKEVTKFIPCSKAVVQAFLTAGGVRIKELQKELNETTRELKTGNVLLSFDNPSGENANMVLRGKSSAMGTAVAMVGEAIREVDSTTVRIMADMHAIPQIIGKGGDNIKKLREGKQVNIEVDRKTGEIAINGLDQEQVKEVQAKVLDVIKENKVLKVPVDPSLIDTQYREIVRSKTRQEVTELARLDVDKTDNNIILRGSDENVQKAGEIIRAYLANNYIESIEITDADRDALLTGGQESKIVKFAKEFEVVLSSNRETSTIQARGTFEKVKAALKALNAYISGGEGNICCKISVAADAIGNVIGKKGSVRKSLESKYPDCSIYIHRTNDAITIRGPEVPATSLRSEVVKLVASARISQEVNATEEQMKSLNKSNLLRRIAQSIPVQCTTEGTSVKVRGVGHDVRDAIALINEHFTGTYTSTMELGESQFAKIKAASRDESHFKRIEAASGASVSLDAPKNAVVVSSRKKDNVKVAKLAVLDFLAFLVPGEFNKLKISKVLQSSVGQATSLIEVGTATGATVYLDRDLSMIIIQSSDADHVAEATKLLQERIKESEKLVYVFEFEPSEAWVIPSLIGIGGKHINSIRKESGCTIEISKEDRTVVVSGNDEEAVAKAKSLIEANVDKTKRETVFINVPEEAMARFVGKGGSHITKLREEYAVEIETIKKGSRVKLTGDQNRILDCKKSIVEWLEEWAKPEEKREVRIQRHHISLIMGERGANVRALQEELGCRIDLDRENLLVTFRGNPVKQELAQRKIEEIVADNPAPQRQPRAKVESEDGEVAEEKAVPESTKNSDEPKKRDEMLDPDAQVDRTAEFPALPIGIAAPTKKKRQRKRKPGKGADIGPVFVDVNA